MRAGDFSHEDDFGNPVWIHNSAPMWIRRFSAIKGVRATFFAVYASIEKVPVGRKPWAVDNRRVGGDHVSLQDAKNAIRAAMKDGAKIRVTS